MKIGERSIEIKGWQFIVAAALVALMITAMTITQMQKNVIEMEETKVTQEEKSNRGHWLWGHWDDVAETKE